MNSLLQINRPAPIQVFKYLVTLVNHRTGDEKAIQIATLSDRYTDVSREIACQKAAHGLAGYSYFEHLDLNDAF